MTRVTLTCLGICLASCARPGQAPLRAPPFFTLQEAPSPLSSCPPDAEGPYGVRCHWRLTTVDYSTGAPRPPVQVCVCDECQEQDHCRARSGGRCVEVLAAQARLTLKSCVYPEQPCHRPCGEKHHCAVAGRGQPACLPHDQLQRHRHLYQ